MSGICGIFALDGSCPKNAEIELISVHLVKRGPDGTRHWQNGQMAMGHTLLATTPEALVEVLPLTESSSGCTITADVRLDNREELLTALGLGGETRIIGDGELILRAYLRWGEECVSHLLGDFAFGIWDPRVERLFCARDHMGMRQLIYTHTQGRMFAFASEAMALVAHPSISKETNEARIADFLDEIEGIDFTSTCFKALQRLPPAHWLTVDARGLAVQRYWSLVPGPPLKLETEEHFANAFVEIFREAVRCRLRNTGQIASMLSGGIDSNAVAAVAAELLRSADGPALPTYSAVASSSPNCPETQAIRLAISTSNYDPVLVDYDELADAIPDLTQSMRELAEPFEGHMLMLRAIYRRAHQDGHKILLDGLCADVVLTAGNGVARALRSGRLVDAWRIAIARRKFSSSAERPSIAIIRSTWSAFAPNFLKRLRQRATDILNNRALARGQQIVAPAFAARIHLPDRRRAYHRKLGRGASMIVADRARTISQPWVVAGRERYDRIASSYGIEPRDPFLDIRVIAFCLSLPPEQLEADGIPKAILRRAMDSLVPGAIRWRRGKEHLGGLFAGRISERWDAECKPASGWAQLEKYVSASALANPAIDNERRLTLITLAFWLERIENDAQRFK